MIPVRNRLGFFFKNNLHLSCLLKKCLYLCKILINKTIMKANTQIKIGVIIAAYFIIRTLINI